jgi:uncharacterized membrane protein
MDRHIERNRQRRMIITAGVLLGIGLGGFVDGIVFHQILQWHHMLTGTGDHPATTVAGLETNTLWDGLFHATTWAATLAGMLLLRRAGQHRALEWPLRAWVGLLLIGFGAFNLVEGLVDHFLLGIHHVREDTANQFAYDIAFLVWGAAMLLGGLALLRTATGRRAPEPGVRRDPGTFRRRDMA